jgi:carbon-monoxide dehydrogenase small subunit
MNRVSLRVNEQEIEIQAPTLATLLDVLRDHLHLNGAKRGCSYGVCGACTVLIDGKPGRSCLALAANCEGRAVTTVESLATDGRLHPVQQALLDCAAVQCGFCIPGIVLTAKALLDERPRPSADQVRHALSGNICRCSGYAAIVEAVIRVAHG